MSTRCPSNRRHSMADSVGTWIGILLCNNTLICIQNSARTTIHFSNFSSTNLRALICFCYLIGQSHHEHEQTASLSSKPLHDVLRLPRHSVIYMVKYYVVKCQCIKLTGTCWSFKTLVLDRALETYRSRVMHKFILLCKLDDIIVVCNRSQ